MSTSEEPQSSHKKEESGLERLAGADKSDKSKWADVIKAVNSPLAYFVVPSLCFESLTAIAMFSNLAEAHKFVAFLVGQGCTLLAFAVVSWITIRYPRHLNAEMAKALEKAVRLDEFLQAEGLEDVVLDIMERHNKSLPSASDHPKDKDSSGG